MVASIIQQGYTQNEGVNNSVISINNQNIKSAVKLWYLDQQQAERKYGHISTWDTSEVTDMSYLFSFDNAGIISEDISGWDVSKVTTMEGMFCSNRNFNQDISKWDVSNVTNMGLMFAQAYAFNQDIGQWNVSNVIDMQSMFYLTMDFNQDISKWNVSNVIDMMGMFCKARAFNQDINTKKITAENSPTGVEYTAWNVSSVTNMQKMFYCATTFNKDIGQWNVSQVTDMRSMFCCADNFNKSTGKWHIRDDCNVSNMFAESGVSRKTSNPSNAGISNKRGRPKGIPNKKQKAKSTTISVAERLKQLDECKPYLTDAEYASKRADLTALI